MLVYDSYYDVKGVSNSSLKHINPAEGGSPQLFKQHWDDEAPPLKTSSLEFGNLLHLAVLEPDFLNYSVDDGNTPDKIRDILKDMYSQVKMSDDITNAVTGENISIGPIENYAYVILSVCDKHSYGKTWKDETRINKILTQGYKYWNLMRDSDKFIITKQQEDLMHNCLDSLRNNKNASRHLFGQSIESKNDDEIEVYNELEIHWKNPLYCFPLKAKIDRIQVNHSNRTFQIIDLKTTSKSLGQFHESFEHYRYYRQVAYYEEAAKQYLKDVYDKTYVGVDHAICAVETKGFNNCEVFTISIDSLSRGEVEMQDLLERLNEHFSSDNWNQTLETIKNIPVYL